MKEQPWHAEALRLRNADKPASYRMIAAACGVSSSTVRLFFNPDQYERLKQRTAAWTREKIATDPAFRERHTQRNVARAKERRATDPAFRERHLAHCRKANKRFRIREAARAEAAETGRPVEEVYAAWGVS